MQLLPTPGYNITDNDNEPHIHIDDFPTSGMFAATPIGNHYLIPTTPTATTTTNHDTSTSVPLDIATPAIPQDQLETEFGFQHSKRRRQRRKRNKTKINTDVAVNDETCDDGLITLTFEAPTEADYTDEWWGDCADFEYGVLEGQPLVDCSNIAQPSASTQCSIDTQPLAGGDGGVDLRRAAACTW